jgi:hypothetical protein
VQVEAATSQALLLVSYPTPSNGWHARISVLNPSNGTRRLMLAMPFEREPGTIALGGGWLVYTDASAVNGSYRSVDVEQLATQKRTTLQTVPEGTYSAGPIRGLTIIGNRAYWLSTWLTPDGLVSRVYTANLVTGRVRVVTGLNEASTHRLYLTMAPARGGFWLSVDQNTQTTKPGTGALVFWSRAKGRITRKVPLFHAPTLLNGSRGALMVVFSANYHATEAADSNRGPFPWYALIRGRRTLRQVTAATNPGGVVTEDGSWLAVTGLGEHSELIDIKRGTVMPVSEPFIQVGGGWLIVRKPGGLRWHRLAQP